ncbi:hypothetical protein VTO42DRAFT_238 [Malbranchea cinnamomea]
MCRYTPCYCYSCYCSCDYDVRTYYLSPLRDSAPSESCRGRGRSSTVVVFPLSCDDLRLHSCETSFYRCSYCHLRRSTSYRRRSLHGRPLRLEPCDPPSPVTPPLRRWWSHQGSGSRSESSSSSSSTSSSGSSSSSSSSSGPCGERNDRRRRRIEILTILPRGWSRHRWWC